MARYPELTDVAYGQTVSVTDRWRTLVSCYDSPGALSRRQKWLFPRRDVTVRYTALRPAEARILWQFYCARAGRFEAFSFFLPWPDEYHREYVATGDGSTTQFNLPSVQASGLVLHQDAVTLTHGADYTFTPAAGADGADRLVMTVPPSAGARLTCDFAGRLKIRCAYAEDSMSREVYLSRLTSVGVSLAGELNA